MSDRRAITIIARAWCHSLSKPLLCMYYVLRTEGLVFVSSDVFILIPVFTCTYSPMSFLG